MSNAASQPQREPERSQSNRATDPFLNMEGAAFLEDKAPGTDSTPTIISKNINGIVDAEAVRSETSSLGDLRGRRLAHFELIEPIGVGGMAAVLRARDTQLDRSVALKILPPDMATEDENIRRFHQEARAAAKLDHENIARVFFCGEDQRLHFIAFEFVEGDNLRALVEKRGWLPVKEAIHYMLQIAAGLAHASERGVVHRDIKPSNIIITPDGRAKLVDMGLARSLEPHNNQALTQSGVTLGTFDYISPEQALEPREADVRSDIYSLGCTFYHVLTGQPPVPEGTAAKKLHHHQHVLPLDPRQLNPNIPDNVAAILARMMAKDAKNRYQRPEHLVQHLLQVAQELGMPTDVSSGVLYIDAPLPNPPQKRPGLMIGLALAGLAIALVVLSFAPGENDPTTILPIGPGPQVEGDPAPQPVFDKGNNNVVVSKAERTSITVSDQPGLVKALKAPGDIKIALEGDIFLGNGGLTFQGDRKLEIEGKSTEGGEMSRLRLDYDSKSKTEGGLVLDATAVRISNIRFEVNEWDSLPPALMFAFVVVKNGGEVTFEDCIFSQKPPEEYFTDNPASRQPLASVAASKPGKKGGRSPILNFNRCLFLQGPIAVALEGMAELEFTDCAFGPHDALFHLFGESVRFSSKLTLKHCSALVTNGPVLRLDGQASCMADFQHSLFTGTNLIHPKANLIHQTEETEPNVIFSGTQNCYHNLNNFWYRTGEVKNFHTLLLFQKELKEVMAGLDESFLDLKVSPLATAKPLTKLAENPKLAFQLDPEIPELRPSGRTDAPVGVRENVWGKTHVPGWWDLPQDKPSTPVASSQDYIVDPFLKEMAPSGHFRTLEAAIAEAKKDGAVILLKHNGLLPIQSVRINHPGKKITIKPHEGFRPVLTLDTEGSPADAALFDLLRGQVVFKELAFLLEPDGKDQFGQSVVALSSQGHCVFKDCVLTLRPSLKYPTVGLNAVTFTGSVGQGSDGKPILPRIELIDSLVRGEGIFLNFNRASPYDLEVKNSLVMLAGTLVQASINSPAKGITGTGRINLARSTIYTQNHLVQLTDEGSGMGLISTSVSASDCLFAADGSPMPLIQFTGPATKLNQLFLWSGTHNAYCGYDTILYQEGPLSTGGFQEVKTTTWQMRESMEGDDNQKTRFIDETLDFELMGDRMIPDIRPEDVEKMMDDLHKQLNNDKKPNVMLSFFYGANLGQLKQDLPLPRLGAPLDMPEPEEMSDDESEQ